MKEKMNLIIYMATQALKISAQVRARLDSLTRKLLAAAQEARLSALLPLPTQAERFQIHILLRISLEQNLS